MSKFSQLGLGLLGCSVLSCGFTANSGDGDDRDARDNRDGAPLDAPVDSLALDASEPPDAPPGSFVVDHLGIVDPARLQGTLVIDTPTNVSSLSLVAAVQTAAGGQISVLYFDKLIVNTRFTIDGNKPVLLVGNEIIVNANGGINAGADGIVAIAGGGDFNARGAGGGGSGKSENGGAGSDSGGGGGGFGTAGALGGTVNQGTVAAGTAGLMYGTPQMRTLIGGSAGGDSACGNNIARGGAGGGALQLTGRISIILNGPVTAGGGGGAAGKMCDGDYDSGAGGGSGGVIFIQSPRFILSGEGGLYANGGGGGAGAQNVTPFFGTPGQNGAISITPAAGGLAVNAQLDRNGGAGGVQGVAPGNGGNGNNAGGGGGAVGRIVIHGTIPIGTFSPMPVAYN